MIFSGFLAQIPNRENLRHYRPKNEWPVKILTLQGATSGANVRGTTAKALWLNKHNYLSWRFGFKFPRKNVSIWHNKVELIWRFPFKCECMDRGSCGNGAGFQFFNSLHFDQINHLSAYPLKVVEPKKSICQEKHVWAFMYLRGELNSPVGMGVVLTSCSSFRSVGRHLILSAPVPISLHKLISSNVCFSAVFIFMCLTIMDKLVKPACADEDLKLIFYTPLGRK